MKNLDYIKNHSHKISLEWVKAKFPKGIFTLYYNYYQGIFSIGFFGWGIRAKNISRAIFTGNINKVHRIGNWIYVFGRVS